MHNIASSLKIVDCPLKDSNLEFSHILKYAPMAMPMRNKLGRL